MSAKNIAEIILRDFRASMATEAYYTFDSVKTAEEVFGELFDMVGFDSGIDVWSNETEFLRLYVTRCGERTITL